MVLFPHCLAVRLNQTMAVPAGGKSQPRRSLPAGDRYGYRRCVARIRGLVVAGGSNGNGVPGSAGRRLAGSPRGRRRRRAALIVGLGAVLVCAAAAIAPGGQAIAAAASRAKVCGGLVPDADYVEDVAGLGVEHACEHLKGRRFSEPAGSSHTDVHADVAAMALSSTDPSVIGRWSSAKNPGTKTIGISAVMLQ